MAIKSFTRSLLSSPVSYGTAQAGNIRINSTLFTDYLIVAGGGGGGSNRFVPGGGAGAGGYLNSYLNELSGGNTPSLSSKFIDVGDQYYVSIGAGGGANANGSNTVFDDITAIGGGFGATYGYYNYQNGSKGGSGGGGGIANDDPGTRWTLLSGTGTTGQGFEGGPIITYRSGQYTPPAEKPGGGGAGGPGSPGSPALYATGSSYATGTGAGGPGIASSITGTSVIRASGGGGSGIDSGVPPANSGNGGRRATSSLGVTGGGSGVVILRYPNTFVVNIGAGLTGNSYIVGSDRVTEITAGTGYIVWGVA